MGHGDVFSHLIVSCLETFSSLENVSPRRGGRLPEVVATGGLTVVIGSLERSIYTMKHHPKPHQFILPIMLLTN